MIAVNCAICDKNNSEILYSRGVFKRGEKLIKFDNVICKKCGLVYINPRMNPEEIEGFSNKQYVENRYALDSEEKIEQYIEHIEQRSKGKINLEFLKKYLKPDNSVLEIGSGFGSMLRDIRNDLGCNVKGIEPAISADYAFKKFNLDIFKGTFEDYLQSSLNEQKFDFILMHHVFEHFPQPIKILNKIKNLLKPDGLIYIEVPNILNFERRVKYFFDFWHFYNYSPDTLSKVLRRGGFKIIDINKKKPSRVQIVAAKEKNNLSKIDVQESSDYDKIKAYINRRKLTDFIVCFFKKMTKIFK